MLCSATFGEFEEKYVTEVLEVETPGGWENFMPVR